MDRPNLFTYATKELSQDAMICWLMKCSAWKANDPANGALCNVGREFVDALLRKHRKALKGEVKRVSIYQQDIYIDVLARVEDAEASHVLLIEDKTHTGKRNRQLEGYYEKVRNGQSKLGSVQDATICPIFLKTGNQPLAEDDEIESKTKYKVFNRRDWLKVLDRYRGDNPIVTDFRAHLKAMEDDFKSYRFWKPGDHGSRTVAGWHGLFRALEEDNKNSDEKSEALRSPGWNYVPQKDGGFWAFHWGWADIPENCKTYLQLEVVPGKSANVCFKIGAWSNPDDDYRQRMKVRWSKLFQHVGGQRVCRPQRLKKGASMTVAVWKDKWPAFTPDRELDVTGVRRSLKAAQDVLDDSVGLFQIVDQARQKDWPRDAEPESETSYQWGRLGFLVRGREDDASSWTPGLFVGVLLDGHDHCTHLLNARGDACVILSVHPGLQPASEVPEYQTLVAGLQETTLPEGWEFYDHVNDERVEAEGYGAHNGPNPWHPIHIRCRQTELLKSTVLFHTQACEVVSAILDSPALTKPWTGR